MAPKSQHSVYLPPEVWAKLEVIAEEEVTSVSGLIKRILVKHLRELDK